MSSFCDTIHSMTADAHDVRHLKPVFWLFVILQILLFSPRLNSDGAYYYEYLRSWVLQNDLNFHDEREFFTWEWVPVLKTYLPGDWEQTGYPPNIFSFGPAMIWMPFFVAGHLIALFLKVLGLPVSTTGYGMVTRFLPMLSSMLAGLAALVVMDRTGREAGFEPPDRAAALFFLLGASHFPAFLFVTPAFAHAFSVLFSAVFLYIWYVSKRLDFTSGQFALFGIVAGLAVTARWQNLFLMILPAADIGLDLLKVPGYLKKNLKNWIVFGIAVLLVIAPQLVVTRTLYGTLITDPQGEGGMLWMNPKIRLVLFNAVQGLFSLNPLLLPAVVALPFLWRRNSRLTWGMLLVVVSQSYINAVRRDWAGVGFGMRRFLNLTPGFALGMMVLFAFTRPPSKRWVRKLFLLAGGILIVWNLLLMAQYYLSELGAPWSPVTGAEMIRTQFTRSPGLFVKLIGTGLFGNGFQGDVIALALGVLGAVISVMLFVLMPAIDSLIRAAWFRRTGVCLVLLGTAWMMVMGWLLWGAASARMYHVIDLSSPGYAAIPDDLRLNPSTGYQGSRGGLVFGPLNRCEKRNYHVHYDKNRFLAPGWMTRTGDASLETGNHVRWVFRDPVETSAVELISRLETSDDMSPGRTVARITITDIHGDRIHLPVIFRIHTGCTTASPPVSGTLIERRWPALNPIETAVLDTRTRYELPGPGLITSLEITAEHLPVQWFVRGIALQAPVRSMKPVVVPGPGQVSGPSS
jgi:hypothetical protein